MAFNSLHTALEAAVNALLATGLCGEINLVMSPNFNLEDNIIKAAEYRVECVKPVSASNTPMVVAFEQPTQREDGSVLMCSDISGYAIVFDGSCATGYTLTAEGKSKPVTSCVGGE